MARPGKRQRKSIQFRVEKRKIHIRKIISENLSKPRIETSPEAARLGKPLKTPLPPHELKHLRGRAVDLSPQALRTRSYKGISQGGITHTKRKTKRYKRFDEGKKSHLLDETNNLTGDIMPSPYQDSFFEKGK